MTNFYISDTHFDHFNIIRLCERPFKTLDEMNGCMIRNWNERVKDDDDVRFLGDFAWGNARHFFDQLKGRKHMIWGNHDKCSRDLPWVSATDYAEIEDGPFKLKLFHYPIIEWNGFYKGHFHFYGHVHTNEMKEQPLNWRARSFNVGAEKLNYQPKTAEEIIMSGNQGDDQG